MLVDNRADNPSDFRRTKAVTAIGKAEKIDKEKEIEITEAYLDRHPHLKDFLISPSCAIIRIEVEMALKIIVATVDNNIINEGNQIQWVLNKSKLEIEPEITRVVEKAAVRKTNHLAMAENFLNFSCATSAALSYVSYSPAKYLTSDFFSNPDRNGSDFSYNL